jgi:hypothetical protein
VQANQFTRVQAGQFRAEWTTRATRFHGRFNAEGMIPVSLTELEMAPDKARAFGPQQP